MWVSDAAEEGGVYVLRRAGGVSHWAAGLQSCMVLLHALQAGTVGCS